MILQDLRRHLFRTLYYVYAVYELERAVSEETAEVTTNYGGYAYWAAYDYKVENGQFVLVEPFLINTSANNIVGRWTLDITGSAVNRGTTLYRIDAVTSNAQTYTKYENTAFGYKPGEYLRQERTLEANFPAKGPSGGYWYELLGTTESQETEWYWEYTKAGIFVPHTSGIYRVACIGGGGGGGAGGQGDEATSTGDASDTYGGGGGGSGYPGTTTVKDVLLTEGTQYSVTIGSAGRGGIRANGTAGTASSFGSLVQGAGGNYGRKGGDAKYYTGPGSGGAGGNSGKSGTDNKGGAGGAQKGTSNNTYNWRFSEGTGGPGGKGSASANAGIYGENGSAGKPGIVIVEFRGV